MHAPSSAVVEGGAVSAGAARDDLHLAGEESALRADADDADDAGSVPVFEGLPTCPVCTSWSCDHCANCGEDLKSYRHPNGWSSGKMHCDSCPHCGSIPIWRDQSRVKTDHNAVGHCKECDGKFVYRFKGDITTQHLLRASDLAVLKTRILRGGHADTRCGACREEGQARVHYANYLRAARRSKEKRASQARGLERFRAAEAAAREKEKEKESAKEKKAKAR